MKTFKRIDFIVQTSLIIAAPIYILFIGESTLFFWYFIVGGLQLLSCLLHVTLGNFYPHKERKFYYQTLLGFLIVGVLMLPVVLIYLFLLLILSPVLAIWYTTICYRETKMLEERSAIPIK